MKLDVISLGELLIDFISMDGGVTFRKVAGGAPANVAVACSRLGLKSGFVGKVGEDEFGLFLRDSLRSAGVDVGKFCLDGETGTTLAFVFVDADGERRFQFRRGADGMLSPGEIDENYIKNSRVFHFGSISLISEPARSATLKALKVAKKSGLTVTYDPNLRLNLWENEEEARKWIGVGLEEADVVKMNDGDAWFMFGSGVEDAAEKLLEHAKKVFITFGEKGCYYADKNSKGYSSAYKVRVKDTTGAGDGFMGGVIYGILNGWGMEKIASFSNAVGAITVSRIGVIPSLPTLSEVLRLIKRGKMVTRNFFTLNRRDSHSVVRKGRRNTAQSI